MVGLRVAETDRPSLTWIAWGVALLSTAWEMYAGWWSVFLRGMDQVLLSMRLAVIALLVKLLLAAGLLFSGPACSACPRPGWFPAFCSAGSLDGPAAPAPRQPAPGRRGEPQTVAGHPVADQLARRPAVFQQLPDLICQRLDLPGHFGLAANAEYGLSVQVMQLVHGMAIVWTMVKWPLVGQYRARNDSAGLRRLLAPRVWLQTITFVLLAVMAIGLGPTLLSWFTTDKQILPTRWLVLLAVHSFLEMHFSFWTTLLSTENRIPSLWPTVASNLIGLALVLGLIRFSSLGLGSFVLGPLAAGCLFSYWYWPLAGARNLRTTWLRFTFRRPT